MKTPSASFPGASTELVVMIKIQDNSISHVWSTVFVHLNSASKKFALRRFLHNVEEMGHLSKFVNSYLKKGENFFHLLAPRVYKSIYGEMAPAGPGQKFNRKSEYKKVLRNIKVLKINNFVFNICI